MAGGWRAGSAGVPASGEHIELDSQASGVRCEHVTAECQRVTSHDCRTERLLSSLPSVLTGSVCNYRENVSERRRRWFTDGHKLERDICFRRTEAQHMDQVQSTDTPDMKGLDKMRRLKGCLILDNK